MREDGKAMPRHFVLPHALSGWRGQVWLLLGLCALGLAALASRGSAPVAPASTLQGGSAAVAATDCQIICGTPEDVFARLHINRKYLPTREQLQQLHLPDPAVQKTAGYIAYDPGKNELCVGGLYPLEIRYIHPWPPAAAQGSVWPKNKDNQDDPFDFSDPKNSPMQICELALSSTPPTSSWQWVWEALKFVIRMILGAIAAVLNLLLNLLGAWRLLTSTDVSLSTQFSVVTNLNAWAVGVGDAALVLVLTLSGLNMLLLGAERGGGRELVGRVLMAVLMSHLSLVFIGHLLELHNALCSGLLTTLGQDGAKSLLAQHNNVNYTQESIFSILEFLLQTVALVLVSLQLLVRLALLDLLIVVAPLAAMCFALPQTEEWWRKWCQLFIATLLVQFFQLCVIGLGGAFITHVQMTDLKAIALLLGIASIYLALQIPGMMSFELGRAMRDLSLTDTSTVVWGGIAASGKWVGWQHQKAMARFRRYQQAKEESENDDEEEA